MASLAFVFTGPDGAITVTRSVADADAARLVAAYGAFFGPVPVDPAAPAGARRAMTTEEIIARWADGQIAASIDFVLGYEQRAAAELASRAVQRIEVTP